MTSTQHSGRHRSPDRGATLRRRLTTVSLMGAAGTAGWLWTSTTLQQPAETAPAETAPAQTAPAHAEPTQPAVALPAHREIQRYGQVIAATRDSVTTSTPGGQTTTFRVTPDTARIGESQSTQTAVPASFPLKSHVVVLGVIHDGVAVATAIADQAAVGPDGPPMDYHLPT
ncbi:hypothetical protein ACNUDN_27040 [Mycobacterium sp. smrl_JER01]|uniref:hypothetical protein n=1 Tax=Mycobacterium sp. smrl_JER01 TaxID=3402633 RepID=UPI003AD244F8